MQNRPPTPHPMPYRGHADFPKSLSWLLWPVVRKWTSEISVPRGQAGCLDLFARNIHEWEFFFSGLVLHLDKCLLFAFCCTIISTGQPSPLKSMLLTHLNPVPMSCQGKRFPPPSSAKSPVHHELDVQMLALIG